MRPTLDQWAMKLARATAERATCLRRSVGCVLLDGRGKLVATGYNGVASGAKHCNEPGPVSPPSVAFPVVTYPHACAGAAAPSGTGLDACEAVHAEQNALLQCADVTKVYACYVTASPCVTCTKLLLNTGCQKIVFDEEYPQPAAQDLWFKSRGEAGLWIKLR